MNIQQLTAKYGKGTVKQGGIEGIKAKYGNGAGLQRWEASKKTVTPTPTVAPISTPITKSQNIFQKAKTAVSNVFKPKKAPVVQPSNNLGVGSNMPEFSAQMTATPKQDKIMTETAKFGAKTVFGFADLITESLDYVTDYAAHNLVDKKKPQLKIIADANDKWTKFYDEQSALGNIPTEKLKKYVDTIQKSSFIQNSPEWEKATTKEKLTTKLGETVLNLAPSVLSSAAAFIINPTFGFVVSAASTANDVKDTAIEYGVEPDKAEKLGLATGLLVGALDRIVPDEVMSGDVKNKFIGSFAKRILARVVKTGKTVLTEASTEVLQEDIQMIAEATFRDDLGWDEVNTRQAMAGLGGFIGGAGFSMIGNFSDNTISKDILGRPEKGETAGGEVPPPAAGVNVEEKIVEKTKEDGEVVTPPKPLETTKVAPVVAEPTTKGAIGKYPEIIENNGRKFLISETENGYGTYKNVQIWTGTDWKFTESFKGRRSIPPHQLERIAGNYPLANLPLLKQTQVEKPQINKNEQLPKNISGAKPRYNYGEKVFSPQFESDIDKALFITSNVLKKSPADSQYRDFLKSNGLTDYMIEKGGQEIRQIIKGIAKDTDGGTQTSPAELIIPKQWKPLEPVKTIKTEPPKKGKEVILAPSKAKPGDEVVVEANKAGVNNTINAKKILQNKDAEYNKPTIGVTEIKTLTSHPEFKANPVMTYTEDGKLYFKSNKLEVTVYPEALNINTENLTVGDKIRIDLDALKKSKGVQQTRLYKGNEVFGFNPKTIAEAPFSPEAKLEMDKVVRQQDIAEMLTKKLGVPLRRGKFRHAGAIGLYKSKQKVARYKSGGFPTVAHEAAGHYLDDMFGFSNNIDIEERRKLMTEYGYSYEGQPHKQRKEAFAEFMRFTLTGQNEKAKTYAPKFFEEYNKKIDKMPEIKKVLDEAAHQYKLYAEQPAVAKVASVLSVGQEKKPGFLQSLNQNLQDKYTQTLDELHPLDEFTKLYKKLVNNKLAGNLDPYMLARTFKGWQSKANLFLNKGTFGKTFWTKNKDTGKAEMKFKGKSYSEIMKPVEQAGALDEFRVYVVAQRVVNDLAPRGKKSGIELKDAKQALEELNKSHPEFEKVAEERRQYKDELLDFAAENGLIGSDQLARIKELNKYHVPFYRVMEESSSGFMGKRKIAGNMGSPIKGFKGSDRLIIDPFESDIKDTYAIINAAERNNIGIAMANLANKHYELGRLFEKVDAPMKATTVNVKEVLTKALEGTETTIDDIPEDLEDAMVTLFRPTQDRGANMLNVNVGDKKLVYQVDPDLFKAIQGMNAEEVNAIVKLMSMPAKALRLGATLSPDFAVRNPFRDLFSAFVYSNYGFTPGVDFVKGVFEIMKKGDIYNLWVAGGGENSMMVSMDRGNLQKSFKEMMRTNKQEALSYAKNPIKFLRILSELGEAGTRLGEMKRAINAGADPITAAFASREVTLDFARIGAKTKAINMIIAFFNANIQGTDKMVRSFRKAPVRSLAKSIIGITLPSILLYLANRDDKRWKEIPRWQKDLFWIVLTPNHVWRIPKPFELGTIFGSVPERILEYMETKDPKVFTQLEKSIMDGFTPGFIPTGLLPIWENISNYSFFRDQPIVSEGQLNLPPEEQSSRYTSEVAKIMGNVLGYPPLKIDNLIQGYTGGLGKYTTSFIDTILTNTGIVPSDVAPPSKTLEDMPVIKAFMVRNPVGSQSESVNRIYTEFEDVNARLTQAKKLLNEGEMEKFNNYVKKYPEAIDAIPLQSVITSFTKLNQVADLIRKDKTLSPDEKRDKLLKIDEFKTEMARTTLDQIDKDRLERDKKEKPPKTSMKFELVKKAYAADKIAFSGDARQEEVYKKMSNEWTTGEASYYNPTNPKETREGTDGTGAYGRKVESGSVAFGNRVFHDRLKKGEIIYIQVKGFENVKTPYGMGVFRVDDTMNKRYSQKGKFNIDFNPKDITPEQRSKGRYPIEFKIVEPNKKDKPVKTPNNKRYYA